MSIISSKFLAKFRNLKTDAAPRAPRPPPPASAPAPDPAPAHDDACSDDNYSDNEKDAKKSKEKLKFDFDGRKARPSKEQPSSPVNTQATGNVINIVNSNNIHWGPEITYYNNLGAPPNSYEPCGEKEDVKRTQTISALLISTDKPAHVYMDFISKNLGKKWRGFFRNLGYTPGRIETVEESELHNGICEVRYKLLLDWVRNDDDGTLGRLSTALWQHGERLVVKDLAEIYTQRST